jgi:hypothetical protein
MNVAIPAVIRDLPEAGSQDIPQLSKSFCCTSYMHRKLLCIWIITLSAVHPEHVVTSDPVYELSIDLLLLAIGSCVMLVRG